MIIPPKLNHGDEIRVIAPSDSLSEATKNSAKLAKDTLEAMGYTVTFGENVYEENFLGTASVESRVADLHAAFEDENVKAILAVIGGYNVNQILSKIDYSIIKNNPKIICGFSDITALTCAITAKTGMITYSGPFFLLFAMQEVNEYWKKYFNKCLSNSEAFELEPSKEWSDDEWYKDQSKRDVKQNDGYWIINEGSCSGNIIGGNLCTLNLLQGTEFMPSIKNAILFIEDDYEVNLGTFDRDLQSLIHQPDFNEVKGIVIGRFQIKSEIKKSDLFKLIKSKPELKCLPVIANADIGHTNPLTTFPIGGSAKLKVDDKVELIILEH